MRPTVLLAALTLIGVGGCEKGVETAPAPEARVSDGKAIDSDAGVKVTVDPSRYIGVAGNEGDLVQMHLEIDNNSNRPLRLSYSGITLEAPDGRTWTSLDPNRVDLSSIGIRDDLLDKGVSEMIFETGNEIDGYIYFQNIDPDVRRANLHIDLVDASNGQRFGELEVPMLVYPEGQNVSMAR